MVLPRCRQSRFSRLVWLRLRTFYATPGVHEDRSDGAAAKTPRRAQNDEVSRPAGTPAVPGGFREAGGLLRGAPPAFGVRKARGNGAATVPSGTSIVNE